MKVSVGLDQLEPAPAGRAVSVGTFDGVHLGHQRILGQVAAVARARGLRAAAVTFDPHPVRVLGPGPAPPRLSDPEDQAEQMAALGLDELIVLPFTAALAAMPADVFARDILAGALRARYVCEGWNFRFGRGGQGTPALLAELGPSLGFEAESVPPVELAGQPLSSTLTRAWLAAGDAAMVWQALGRPYQVSGMVGQGDGRGRELGFPTANMTVAPERALPAAGVYAVAVRARQDDQAGWLPGMANLGSRPTFGGQEQRLEAHVLAGGRHFYGETLTLAFLRRLRDEQRFPDAAALVAQLERDRRQAQAVWAELQGSLTRPAERIYSQPGM